ncbi:tRNA pseudouridine(38-40) synthase TruA [Bombilactobacillus thymidiniphilus]|uniref:tRNA pseudouridine synthase A n=1 Tax=Bombilactobacillus thymidiniphilus TaxID=2923363 RepID=A0ABY4PEI5_9LACO|nr:tRNA pseudouridine(38-40) synthase TruA [Bombilactobacillus thymidiniphilus]UQS83970.1 tRNA pseudouridine(38-40) synthase TruA [Bombilactobacillus thymidiniphilus]
MTNYKMTIAYDGTRYHGFQKQPQLLTVQGVIETALLKMTKQHPVEIIASGRTDAGVHAKGQVISFNYPGNIPAQNMLKALNSLMPLDILFVAGEQVAADFNARFDTISKIYEYRVALGRYTDPFLRLYTGHYPYKIDLGRIQTALKDIVGKHDFTSFAASGGVIKNKVREVYRAEVDVAEFPREITFRFHGNGFLYNMVRIMVATLLDIGNGRRDVHDFLRLYEVKDRQQARLTAPASGLYLKQVFYE